MKKRVLSLLLAVVLAAGATANAAFPSTKTYTPGQFSDVADGVWYSASVQKAYELGLMNGSSDTTFNPGGMFTVAEAITVAGRMHSLAHGGSDRLPSASGAWYQGAVDYCVKNKLISDSQFDSYTRAATRAEMAGVIRAALPDDQWKAINSVSALPDVSAGTDYAQAIFDLYNAGVFTGSDDYGQFQPYAQITRAEVAAIVARCADPAQRKTLTLKPLSQRQAPEIIGGYQSRKMSNGRLPFQDPDTQKWGYLDGNGNVVIPAQYDKAEDFESGYAKVENNGKYGLLNTAGTAVLPLEYREIHSLGDGAFAVSDRLKRFGLWINGNLVTDLKYTGISSSHIEGFIGDGLYKVSSSNGNGLINSNGQEIVPCKYGYYVGYTGIYAYGCTELRDQPNLYDIYDLNGGKLMENARGYAKGNPLLAVKEGNKYALATPSGRITEAVYDSVDPIENTSFATVKYGNQRGLVGLSGELIAPGTYDVYSFNGDYFVACNSEETVVGDATGVLYTGKPGIRYDFYHSYPQLLVYQDAGMFYCGTEYDEMLLFKDGTSKKVKRINDSFTWQGEDGAYLITAAGKVFGPRENYWEGGYKDKNGQYGLCDETGELTEPIYEDYNEFSKAHSERQAELYARPENQKYEIRNNSAGKPIVRYGNDTNGWTNVIEFYKNNMYYDEIRELGEGYYACRFNTTWYLLHA